MVIWPSDIWLRTILIVRKETRCRNTGYYFRLAARVHRQDSTYHGFCYTSRVALAGKIAQWVHPMKDRSDDPSHHGRTLLPRSYISLLVSIVSKLSTGPKSRIRYSEIEKFREPKFVTCPTRHVIVLVHLLKIVFLTNIIRCPPGSWLWRWRRHWCTLQWRSKGGRAEGGGGRHLHRDGYFARKCISTTPIGVPIYIYIYIYIFGPGRQYPSAPPLVLSFPRSSS